MIRRSVLLIAMVVWLALLVLTVVTVLVTRLDLGALKVWAALAVAVAV